MMQGGDQTGSRPSTPTYFRDFVPGRRGEVLDAALNVFAERGYEGGTMREIAACLGVSEPALYRHYPSKEALYSDVVGRAGDHVVEQAALAVEQVAPANLHESLVRLVHARRRRDMGPMGIMRTLLVAAPHDDRLSEAFRAHLARPMIDVVRTRLVPKVDAFFGISRTPENFESSVRAFMSLFVGYFMTSMIFDQADDEAIAHAMVAVMGWTPGERTAHH